jgi:hypothetical protein
MFLQNLKNRLNPMYLKYLMFLKSEKVLTNQLNLKNRLNLMYH